MRMWGFFVFRIFFGVCGLEFCLEGVVGVVRYRY